VLKNKCGYTGVAPYWDWTLDSADPPAGTIWSDDSTSGLGQMIGVPTNDYVLGTGGFSSDFTLAYPASHGLRRNFTQKPWAVNAESWVFPDPDLDANATFTPEVIDTAVASYTGDFKSFQKFIEGFEGPHGAVHLAMGGDLAGDCPKGSDAYCFANENSPTFSANEPMFWMHHAVSPTFAPPLPPPRPLPLPPPFIHL
jgi:tyrosinase